MEHQIIEHEKTEVQEVNSSLPVAPLQDRLLENALAQGASIEQIDKLLDLKIKYDNEQARKSYSRDFSMFKKADLNIVKDLINSQYGSAYTSINELVSKVSAAMAPFGFTHRWTYSDGGLTVTCIMSHKDGHSESVTLSGDADKSGAKNDLQKAKSTRTYLKIETFEGVTGVTSGYCNVNDDANANNNFITAKKANEIEALLVEKGTDKKVFFEYAKVDSVECINKKDADKLIKALKKSVKKNANT